MGPGQAKMEPKTSQGNPKLPPVDKYQNFNDFKLENSMLESIPKQLLKPVEKTTTKFDDANHEHLGKIHGC